MIEEFHYPMVDFTIVDPRDELKRKLLEDFQLFCNGPITISRINIICANFIETEVPTISFDQQGGQVDYPTLPIHKARLVFTACYSTLREKGIMPSK